MMASLCRIGQMNLGPSSPFWSLRVGQGVPGQVQVLLTMDVGQSTTKSGTKYEGMVGPNHGQEPLSLQY